MVDDPEPAQRHEAAAPAPAPSPAPARSPATGPARWPLPIVGVLTALAAFMYAWRAGNFLEIYYAASVRSMSANWHDFAFGAFDPAGTISLDKLPGAFWIQALAYRALGRHPFVLVLPQVIEGALTVPFLYHAVRRLSGPGAGLVAAGLLVAAPATTALDRGNIPDSLMILLLVLAADATVGAAVTAKPWKLLLTALAVGLAFQAKMAEAWLVLPALAALYLAVAPHSRSRRVVALTAMGVLAAGVSLSWMLFVTVTPPGHRPYVDGSTDNSVFQQVFVYNGFGRVDDASPDQVLQQSIGLQVGGTTKPSWDRLLTGDPGHDTGWLIPPALVALAAGLLARRREGRGDLVRAGFLFWGTWLVVLLVVFSLGTTLNTYYTAALAPPLAALIGAGAALAWHNRRSVVARATVAITVAATAAYAAWLLPPHATGLPGWLRPAVIVLGVLAAAAGLFPTPAVALTLVSLALVPVVASTSVVANRLGPFDTPFQAPGLTKAIWQSLGEVPLAAESTIPVLEKARNGAPYLMATESSAVASPFIYDTGQETLPIGGFTSAIDSPSLATLKKLIAESKFHLVLQSPHATDPRLVWIAHHCLSLGNKKGGGPGAPTFAIYYCAPFSLAPPKP